MSSPVKPQSRRHLPRSDRLLGTDPGWPYPSHCHIWLVPISIDRLAAELGVTQREIRSCVWDLRRYSSAMHPEFVTGDMADRIRAHWPILRERTERQRVAREERLNQELTTSEVASEFGVSPNQIRQWKSRRYLQSVGKSGRSSLYRFADVSRVLHDVERRTRTTPDDIDPRAERHLDRGVTTNQAANLVKVSPSTIRMWVKRGRLQPMGRHSRQLLFVVRDVVAAARRHT
jgi:DNA-binding transcriptional MerR regulator